MGENERIKRIWRGMVARCEIPSQTAYGLYGERGITVCEEWHNYELFLMWALSNGYEDSKSIDRIDPNGNYEPSNCRWATQIEQANNKRVNRRIKYNGETKTLAEWARFFQIPLPTLASRIYRMGEQDAFYWTTHPKVRADGTTYIPKKRVPSNEKANFPKLADIKAIRKQCGFSQGETARRLGVSVNSIYAWEHHKAFPKDEHLEALAALYGVEKERLFKGLDEEREC